MIKVKNLLITKENSIKLRKLDEKSLSKVINIIIDNMDFEVMKNLISGAQCDKK